MARYIRNISGYNEPVHIRWRVAASQTIKEGDLVELDATSRYLKPASASSTTLVGIALESITTGAQVSPQDAIKVLPLTGIVVRMSYAGSSKPTLADSDLATTLFNLSDATTIDLDNTTNGMCSVVAYDNTRKPADVIFAADNVVRL